MVGKSKKNLETEAWVDAFIKEHGEPPTYKMIEKQFNIKRCGAYMRCKKFRHKMRSGQNLKLVNTSDRLVYQLFIGKVSEIIGQKKTMELLKEAKDNFSNFR